MKKALWAFACVVIGCAHSLPPRATRDALRDRFVGKTVEIKQSCFVATFYDENELWLLSPQSLDDLPTVREFGGRVVRPGPRRGIAPAGTAFVVERIEFADSLARTTRMLTTPRDMTWVYLSPVSSRFQIPGGGKHFVLLMPSSNDAATVDRAFLQMLAAQGQVTSWLSKRRPTVQAAIAHKMLVAGMTQDEIVASIGLR